MTADSGTPAANDLAAWVRAVAETYPLGTNTSHEAGEACLTNVIRLGDETWANLADLDAGQLKTFLQNLPYILDETVWDPARSEGLRLAALDSAATLLDAIHNRPGFRYIWMAHFWEIVLDLEGA